MTPEDLYDFHFLADAQISPDGSRVAYVVRTMDREDNAYQSGVWLVPADGSREGTRFTSGPGQDALPRWSPDGKMLAFVSDRDVAADGKKRKPKNIFVLSLAGGEARKLTSFDEDAGDLTWSPDGRQLAFVLKDKKAKDADDEGIRVYDRMRYKTDEGFLLDGRRRHVWVVDITGGEPRRLTEGDWDDAQPAWSPDSREIAFVSNRTEDRERNIVVDIWVATVDGGATRRITDELGSYGNPSWSVDGASLACYGVAKAVGSSAKNVHVFTFPAKGGAGKDLTDGWDRTVGSTVMSDMRSHMQTLPPTWSADRTRIIFVGSDQGTANIYSVGADGATCARRPSDRIRS